MKVFRVGGTTDQITTCELCGKEELRGTVQMIELDADGNDFADLYYGSSCAAKAAGWTQKTVNMAARAADRAKKEAADTARRKAEYEEMVHRNKALDWWLQENYGTDDIHQAAKIAGMSFVRVSCLFSDEYERCQ
jgi:ribosome-binding protein aMBF1 (putative translation factor)